MLADATAGLERLDALLGRSQCPDFYMERLRQFNGKIRNTNRTRLEWQAFLANATVPLSVCDLGSVPKLSDQLDPSSTPCAPNGTVIVRVSKGIMNQVSFLNGFLAAAAGMHCLCARDQT